MKRFFAAFFAVAALTAAPLAAQENLAPKPIAFPAGSNSAVVKERIVGKQVLSFTFPGKAGERASITLDAATPSANFNVMAPLSQTSVFVGSMEGRAYNGMLPESGEYAVIVYLMGQAAETGSADVTLTVTLGDEPAVASTNAMPAGGAAATPESKAPENKAPENKSPENKSPDFADGLMGGPDFWEVHALKDGNSLNVRSGPGTSNGVVGQVSNGMIVRNLGCARPRTTVWCQVEATDGSGLKGWVANSYLREGAAPAGAN